MENVLMIFILYLCTLANIISVVNSNSLALRLIHPYSPESPFFQATLSHEDIIRRSARRSQLNSLTARTPVNTQSFHYIVKVRIGTFKSKSSKSKPYNEYFLELDTGSSLTWMQCEGCTKCFTQTPKPFPKGQSSSFRLNYINNTTQQPYECKYADGSSTRGVLARETFYLESLRLRVLAKIENITFGCGLQNDMKFDKKRNNKIAGVMGLGWEFMSFVRQLGFQYKGKFSYCLPILNRKAPNTYLTFGDITPSRNPNTTTLYRAKQSTGYYVQLQGISLNGNKLNINPQVFATKRNGSSGGCLFDSGTPYSRLVKPAFDVLRQELEKYFSSVKGLKPIKKDLGLELCYMSTNSSEGIKKLPEITFHLQGSDFVMKPESGFEIVRSSFLKCCDYFCLAMVSDNNKSIIGAHQQTNHMINYDTEKKMLSFYPQDCSKNPS